MLDRDKHELDKAQAAHDANMDIKNFNKPEPKPTKPKA